MHNEGRRLTPRRMHRAHKHRCSIPPEGVSGQVQINPLPAAPRGRQLGASPRKLHHREGESAQHNKGARGSILLCTTRSPLLSSHYMGGCLRVGLLFLLTFDCHITRQSALFFTTERHHGGSATLLAPQGKAHNSCALRSKRVALFLVGCCCI